MKHLLLVTSCSIFFCFLSRSQNADIETIKKLNYDWLNAYPQKDTATLGKILADDFILINPTGIKQTRKDNLQNLLDPNIETISVSFDSVEVRILSPSVAMLNAWANFTFKANGKQMTGKNCYEDIYIKRNGKWLAIAAHVTSLGMKE
jgi:uncharacterized protein (TIGR02246 family)